MSRNYDKQIVRESIICANTIYEMRHFISKKQKKIHESRILSQSSKPCDAFIGIFNSCLFLLQFGKN